MMMRSGWRRTMCLGLGWVGATLALSVAYGEEPSTDTSAPPADAAPAGGHPPISTHFPRGRRIPYTTDAILDQRVKLLTAEIGLDEHQQAEVRALLVRQGAAIRRVWTDKSLTDGERGPITGAIGEKTADAIRDLLTPAQREKYNPPRPDTGRPKPEQAKDLSRWLDAMQQK